MTDLTSTPAKVRFAPSPTGALHLGSAMVALANAMLARSSGGSLLLRIDDTDQSRSRAQDELDLLRLLRWLDIGWDEGPVRQSERGEEYAAALERLLADDIAYPCFCGVARLDELRESQVRAGQPPRYDGRCRALDPGRARADMESGVPHVLRMRVPEGRDVTVADILRGDIVVPAGAFGDPVLRRANGSAGYLLASVVDDVMFSITHVLRGEDHLVNSATQILLFEALGHDAPAFLHVALLRDADGAKLSKRAPLGTLDELVDEGFLPVTVRRYLAELLGQGPVDPLDADADPRLFFDRLPTGAPRVDRSRLESLGREDMALLDLDDLLAGSGVDASDRLEPLLHEIAADSPSRVALRGELRLVLDGPGHGDLPIVLRMLVDGDLERLAGWDLSYALCIAELRIELDDAADHDDDTERDSDEELAWAAPWLARVRARAKERGIGMRDLLLPLRVALTGMEHGPGLELLLTALGPAEALRRIHLARIVIGDELEQAIPAVGDERAPLG